MCAYKVRARYDDQPHAHLAIAVQGPTSYDSESIALVVAQMILGTWNRTDGAGVNLASKMAAACAEFGAAHSYEAFFHKYSDTSLWSDLCSLLIHLLQSSLSFRCGFTLQGLQALDFCRCLQSEVWTNCHPASSEGMSRQCETLSGSRPLWHRSKSLKVSTGSTMTIALRKRFNKIHQFLSKPPWQYNQSNQTLSTFAR